MSQLEMRLWGIKQERLKLDRSCGYTGDLLAVGLDKDDYECRLVRVWPTGKGCDEAKILILGPDDVEEEAVLGDGYFSPSEAVVAGCRMGIVWNRWVELIDKTMDRYRSVKPDRESVKEAVLKRLEEEDDEELVVLFEKEYGRLG